MKKLLAEAGVADAKMLLDETASNTIENALRLLPIVEDMSAQKEGVEIVLITSDFHMPRAAFIFESVLASARANKQIGRNVTLSRVSAPSGLAREGGNSCPQDMHKKYMNINEWSLEKRLAHEAQLMKERMVPWIQSYHVDCPGVASERWDTVMEEIEGLKQAK